MSLVERPERLVRWFDDVQQRRWWLAHPVGVVRKYADDRGSAFANLLTLQIFLGLLPLLVVALTVFGRVLDGSDHLAEAVLDSTVAQFPVLGEQLRTDVSSVGVATPWLVVSVAGLLWTASGIYHGLQLTLNQVWNVEGVDRQGFVSRHVRAMILFVIVMTAAIGTTFVPVDELVGWAPTGVRVVAAWVVSVAMSVVLLFGMLRIVTSPSVGSLMLVPAAVMSGLLWQLVQSLGSWIVVEQLSGAQDLYGSIGLVVVMLMWINLLARAVVFANEWAVVSWRELWPRRIAQPPLTDADRQVLAALVRNERRRPEQHIDVTFDSGADATEST